jgi:hypoxanthine-guanine phosphoribosyltransferase
LIRKKRATVVGTGDPKYVCFNYKDDDFLMGFGLDNKGYERNLPEIYKMEESDIKASPGA